MAQSSSVYEAVVMTYTKHRSAAALFALLNIPPLLALFVRGPNHAKVYFFSHIGCASSSCDSCQGGMSLNPPALEAFQVICNYTSNMRPVSVESRAENDFLLNNTCGSEFWIGLYCNHGPQGQPCLRYDQFKWFSAAGSYIEVDVAPETSYSQAMMFLDPTETRWPRWSVGDGTVARKRFICQKTDECVSDPCQNGATCDLDTHNGHYLCHCTLGFTGPQCDVDIDECEHHVNVCKTHEVCENTRGSFVCRHNETFYDNLKNKLCDSNPCRNGGSCDVDVYSEMFVCDCQVGFHGKQCDVTASMQHHAIAYLGLFCVSVVAFAIALCLFVRHRKSKRKARRDLSALQSRTNGGYVDHSASRENAANDASCAEACAATATSRQSAASDDYQTPVSRVNGAPADVTTESSNVEGDDVYKEGDDVYMEGNDVYIEFPTSHNDACLTDGRRPVRYVRV